MTKMCDWCPGPPADHDKAYVFGRPDLISLRVTWDEVRCLMALRTHVEDVRKGYQAGPAFGDIWADAPRCAPDGI